MIDQSWSPYYQLVIDWQDVLFVYGSYSLNFQPAPWTPMCNPIDKYNKRHAWIPFLGLSVKKKKKNYNPIFSWPHCTQPSFAHRGGYIQTWKYFWDQFKHSNIHYPAWNLNDMLNKIQPY